jgi:hypothetical protein
LLSLLRISMRPVQQSSGSQRCPGPQYGASIEALVAGG